MPCVSIPTQSSATNAVPLLLQRFNLTGVTQGGAAGPRHKGRAFR